MTSSTIDLGVAFVIDASVAIKWVVDEEETEEALALRRCRLVAPDLLICECATILWKKMRRRELSEAEGLLAARLLERADVEVVPTRRLMEAATRLALTLDRPAYDCVYLALAQARHLTFVTADRRLRDKVAAHVLPVRVLTLADVAGQLKTHAAHGKEAPRIRRTKKERP